MFQPRDGIKIGWSNIWTEGRAGSSRSHKLNAEEVHVYGDEHCPESKTHHSTTARIAGKVMPTVFWDRKGVLIEFLLDAIGPNTGRKYTVNGYR